MKHFLSVGPATTNLRTYIHDRGHELSVLLDRDQTKKPDKIIEGRTITDFANEAELKAAAQRINQQRKIDGVVTTYENSVHPAAIVAETLSLPGLSPQAAQACTDKELMRSLFQQAPLPISPAFQVVTSEEEVRQFAANHALPLILKPANLAKSLLVTKSDTVEELLTNYRHTSEQIAAIYKKYAPHRQPKLLIEEFMRGSIHSIDALVDHEGVPHLVDAVVDYQTGYDVGFADNFHYSRRLPSALSTEQQAALRHTATLGCQALGMRSTPAHIEIIMTASGPRIVEIGARNGGYRERMHRMANGIDLIGGTLAIAAGERPDITKQRNDNCTVVELFPKVPGAFVGIRNHQAVTKLNSFVQMNVKVRHGQLVGRAADGYKMCAVVIFHNPDNQQFEHDLTFLNNEVEVETSPQ